MPRLQLELSETYSDLLERLIPLCDRKTKTDVVEEALMLLGWAATERSNGLVIAAVDEERKVYKEVHTPALEGAQSFAVREKRRLAHKATSKTRDLEGVVVAN